MGDSERHAEAAWTQSCVHHSLCSMWDITSRDLWPLHSLERLPSPREPPVSAQIDVRLREQITSLTANQLHVIDQSSIGQLFCVPETDSFSYLTDRHGNHSDRRQLYWSGVNRNNWKRRRRRQTHPITEADFKRPFVLKLKVQGNTEVTCCHFSSSTCCPSVVSCQGDFPSQKKAPSQIISFQRCRVHTSCHYTLRLNHFLVKHWQRRHFVLSCYTGHHCVWLFFLFVRLKVNFQSVSPSLLVFLIYPRRVDWAHRVFQHHVALHLHSDTVSWELPGTSRILSSSTGAHGIKGKGSSVTVVLFSFLHTSAFSTQTNSNCALSCIDSGQQMEHCISSEWFPSSFIQATSWIITSHHIHTGV